MKRCRRHMRIRNLNFCTIIRYIFECEEKRYELTAWSSHGRVLGTYIRILAMYRKISTTGLRAVHLYVYCALVKKTKDYTCQNGVISSSSCSAEEKEEVEREDDAAGAGVLPEEEELEAEEALLEEGVWLEGGVSAILKSTLMS